MQYKEVLELIKTKVNEYDGNLYFGSGTLNDLNKESRDYPLVWFLRPMNITNSVNESLVVGQAMNFSLLFLQSASLNTSEDQVNQYFNDTLNIANWFLSELIKEFDEDGTNTIATTTITQIYKA
jgi:hypothetical protein